MVTVTYSCKSAGIATVVQNVAGGIQVRIIEKGQKQVQTVPHIIKHKKGELL